jgi:hypothetical protein
MTVGIALLQITCANGYIYCPAAAVNLINAKFMTHAATASMIAVMNALNYLLSDPTANVPIFANDMNDLYETLMFAQKIQYPRLLLSLSYLFTIIVDAEYADI